MSGGMSQREFHERFDPVIHDYASRFDEFFVSRSMVNEFQRSFDPMTSLEEAILLLSQVNNGLRSADEYFSLHGHITLTARSNGLMWMIEEDTDNLRFMRRVKDFYETPPFRSHHLKLGVWYG